MFPKLPGRSQSGSKSHSRRSNRRDPKRLRRDFRLGLQVLEDRLALTTLPAGFAETPFTSGFTLSSPTTIAFSPTGQLWSLEQGGRVRFIRSDGTTPATPAKTLTVDSAGERGLLGIAFDPNYDGAGPNQDFVYLYYTVPRVVGANPPDPSNNQISRFPVLNAGSNTPTLGDPDITRKLPPEDEDNNLTTDGDTNHNGGGLHFGLDGKLYVSVGDHNYDPPADQQANSPAQRLDIPFGKVLRLNTNLTNPSDNPAYDDSASDWPGAIYAMGFRNPFRFAVQPGTGTIFVNDVGESTWEEIDKLVPSDQPGPVADYGWAGSNGPMWEGFEPESGHPDGAVAELSQPRDGLSPRQHDARQHRDYRRRVLPGGRVLRQRLRRQVFLFGSQRRVHPRFRSDKSGHV